MPDTAPPRPPILVVDDNHDNTEIIARYLGVRGYPITWRTTGTRR
jgi:CheY-like chemotaxis protein